MLVNMVYHKKEEEYYKSLSKSNPKDIIFKDGMLVKQFPIKDVELEFNTTNLSKDSFKDLVEVSDKFKAQFYKYYSTSNCWKHRWGIVFSDSLWKQLYLE